MGYLSETKDLKPAFKYKSIGIWTLSDNSFQRQFEVADTTLRVSPENGMLKAIDYMIENLK